MISFPSSVCLHPILNMFRSIEWKAGRESQIVMESQSRRHTSWLCLRWEKRIIPSPSFECTTVQIPPLYSSFQSIDYSIRTVFHYSILDADHESMSDSNPLIPYQRIHSIVAFSPLPSSSPLINGRLSSFLPSFQITYHLLPLSPIPLLHPPPPPFIDDSSLISIQVSGY